MFAKVLGLSDPRYVSKMMEAERGDTVICSCGRGLFLPGDDEAGVREVRQYVGQVEGKGIGSLRSVRSARRWLKDHGVDELVGQTSFGELDED